jgi:GT2 family glycosyltransferase
MKRPIGIIIPTYNNYHQLHQCVASIINNKTADGLFHIYIINNGHKNSCDSFSREEFVTVIDTGDNLGWVGGLEIGMERSEEPLLVFMNDDTFVPPSSRDWLNIMAEEFRDENVGAVGPISNVVMGGQNIWNINDNMNPKSLQRYLIFFCVMIRRDAIERAGGLDSTMSGGDDFDLSIRLWDKGYKTLINRQVFIYHHGFQTGNRVLGDHTKRGGWNSFEYKQRVDTELIRKHGLVKFYETMINKIDSGDNYWNDKKEKESDVIKSFIPKEGTIYEFGVGGEKTVDNAIGIDMIPYGSYIETIKQNSVADITYDLTEEIFLDKKGTIIARQILEHMIDPVRTLSNWKNNLSDNGRLIVTVPDNDLFNFVPVNIEHLHAFNKNSLRSLFDIVGLKTIEIGDVGNGISIYGVAENE